MLPGTGASDLPGDDLAFDCPRCHRPAGGRFYGPCSPCRSELAAMGGPGGGAVEAERFEPRMHVVPNQVATKE